MTPKEIVETKTKEQILKQHHEVICDCCHAIQMAQITYHYNEKLCYCCGKVSRFYLGVEYGN